MGSNDKSLSVSSQAAGRSVLEFAASVHMNQTDKGGEPYILHCAHVAHEAFKMALFEGRTTHFAIRCYRVGMLHDALEDCPHINARVIADLIGGDVEHVQALTKRDGLAHEDYLAGIEREPIANIVKRCDMAHNMDLARLSNPTERDRKRQAKYKRDIIRLEVAARNASEDTQPVTATPTNERQTP